MKRVKILNCLFMCLVFALYGQSTDYSGSQSIVNKKEQQAIRITAKDIKIVNYKLLH